MPFQVSPGVNVTEIDLTTIVPAVSSTEGAIAGIFRWGPAEELHLVTSETELVNYYGKPSANNFETWYTAANFLAYGNKLYVSRAAAANSYNAGAAVSDDYVLSAVAINTAGTGGSYVPGDILYVEGGSFDAKAYVNVVTTEARTLTVVAAGSGYTNSTIIALSTGTGTQANAAVTTNGTGNVTSLSIINRGAYTVNPTLTGGATSNTLGAGSGLTVTVTTRALSVAAVDVGSYTALPEVTTGNIPTGGSGTGATLNLTFSQGSAISNTQIKNRDDYDVKTGSFDADALYFAKWPGYLGNSLKVSVCDSANAYSSALTGNADSVASFAGVVNSNNMVVKVISATSNTNANTMAASIAASIKVGDYIQIGNSEIGFQYLKVTSEGAVASNTTYANSTVNGAGFTLTTEIPYALSANISPSSVTRYWEYFNRVNVAPDTSTFVLNSGGTKDEMHIVVVDEDGAFTGTKNQILEVWPNLSRASDAKGEQGGSIYYVDVINQSSEYIWWASHRAGYNVTTAGSIAGINTAPLNLSLSGGTDGVTESTATLSVYAKAYDMFKSAEDVDVSLILTGKSQFGVSGEGLANYLIDNIAETRKDCVVFVSPKQETVVNNPGDELNDTITFRNALRSTSYAFLDSGYKYQYDKYNDVYRWVPLNGDVAGTVVRTDDLRDPWFSPAGFNRGNIKNVTKLAFNPNKGNRDQLYKAGVNPVVNFPGNGVILYGDKTLLARPSAFDRINVRRLFIVLEKAIAIAAKSTLFELNDEYTRAQFKNLVEPYLRDVKGRRGIYDFRVICDESNNTPERIDRNEFWGDIYIKPARSINFIQLNFIAIRTGVSFDEIVGKF
jgi:hypothetical protein